MKMRRFAFVLIIGVAGLLVPAGCIRTITDGVSIGVTEGLSDGLSDSIAQLIGDFFPSLSGNDE